MSDLDFDVFRLWDEKQPSELVEGQWYWLAPGMCSEEWLDEFAAKAQEAGANVGFCGYHGSAYEVAAWNKEEADVKLGELEAVAERYGFKLVLDPIWYGQGIIDAMKNQHSWELITRDEE